MADTYRIKMRFIKHVLYHINDTKGWEDGQPYYLQISPINEDNDMEEIFYTSLPKYFPNFEPEIFFEKWRLAAGAKDFKSKQKGAFWLPPMCLKQLRELIDDCSRVDLSRFEQRSNLLKDRDEGKVYIHKMYGLSWVLVREECQSIIQYVNHFKEFQNPTLIEWDMPWRDADNDDYGPYFRACTKKQMREIVTAVSQVCINPLTPRTWVVYYAPEQEADVVRTLKETVALPNLMYCYLYKLDKLESDTGIFINATERYLIATDASRNANIQTK